MIIFSNVKNVIYIWIYIWIWIFDAIINGYVNISTDVIVDSDAYNVDFKSTVTWWNTSEHSSRIHFNKKSLLMLWTL